VLDETVGSPKQRSSCAARAELPAGFTHTGAELGFLAICGAADTRESKLPKTCAKTMQKIRSWLIEKRDFILSR
jgi:hypothetical protein